MNIRLPPVCLQLEQNAGVFGFKRVIHTPSVIARRLSPPFRTARRRVVAWANRAGMSPEGNVGIPCSARAALLERLLSPVVRGGEAFVERMLSGAEHFVGALGPAQRLLVGIKGFVLPMTEEPCACAF